MLSSSFPVLPCSFQHLVLPLYYGLSSLAVSKACLFNMCKSLAKSSLLLKKKRYKTLHHFSPRGKSPTFTFSWKVCHSILQEAHFQSCSLIIREGRQPVRRSMDERVRLARVPQPARANLSPCVSVLKSNKSSFGGDPKSSLSDVFVKSITFQWATM